MPNSIEEKLHLANKVVRSRSRDLLRGTGITDRQKQVLAYYMHNAGATQSDASKATQIDRSTMSEMIMRLDDKGLLHRYVSSDDSRANCVELTNAGVSALIKSTDAQSDDVFGLSNNEQMALSRLLDKVISFGGKFDASPDA